MIHRLVAELVIPHDQGVESTAPVGLFPDAFADMQESSILSTETETKKDITYSVNTKQPHL